MGALKKLPDLWLLAVLVLGAWGLTHWIGGRQDATEGQALRALAQPGDIVMLSTATCVYCAEARRWLEAEHVPFRECRIDADPSCLSEFQARGAQGTPTFVVRGKTLLGFDPEHMLALLKLGSKA